MAQRAPAARWEARRAPAARWARQGAGGVDGAGGTGGATDGGNTGGATGDGGACGLVTCGANQTCCPGLNYCYPKACLGCCPAIGDGGTTDSENRNTLRCVRLHPRPIVL
ncbi:MAG: hypothetical protein U0263_36325 [Polyangiaceae bacterium]